MNTELANVVMHIDTYFKNYLPDYSVLEVRRKSNHPDDNYLYMVSAKKKDDGTFAVWTNWNEQTQCLNHGHYGLKSIGAAMNCSLHIRTRKITSLYTDTPRVQNLNYLIQTTNRKPKISVKSISGN